MFTSIDFWIDARVINFYSTVEKFNHKIGNLKQYAVTILQSPEIINNLEEENKRLQLQLATFLSLQAENEQLKAMTKFVPQMARHIATAQLIVRVHNQPGMGKILAGAAQGVRRGQFITSELGVPLGKIISVGEVSSKVSLITEPSSRIAVYLPRVKARAVVSGNYSGRLEVILSENDSINSVVNGDVVVTSGGDGIISGLVMGRVEKTGSNINIALLQAPSNVNTVSIFEEIS